ncbi:helix-turn-helix domain-containing protein [soil metagenome]
MHGGVYHCPVEVTMDVIGGKWTPVVLAHLKEAPRRFSQLRRLIPDITEKMLTQRLRELEAGGIISRTVLGATTPHVVYDLTDDGRSLAPVLQALYDWGDRWATQYDLPIETGGP